MTKLHILEGPDRGASFDLKEEATYVGRSPVNDIRLKDMSVSRRHLKVERRGDMYSVEDLKSRNGTFVDGEQIGPGMTQDVKEGVPIVIGMSVICLGKGVADDFMAYQDLRKLTDTLYGEEEVPVPERPVTTEANIDLINKVSDALMQASDINDVFRKVLNHLFDLLKRIDRGAIVLVDEQTGEVSEVISRSRDIKDTTPVQYSKAVVDRVIADGQAIMLLNTDSEAEVDFSDTLKLQRIKSVMCVPLVSTSQVRGVIYVDSVSRPQGFRKEDLSLLSTLSSLAAIAIESIGT
jgi:pSer/pThr/pTyr-binding forkhead associated (FHA) protein